MFFYYIKIAFKNLWNNKRYSLINIAGFSFGLCITIAIILFIMHEYSYDRYHQKSESIFRLIDEKHSSSDLDYRMRDLLMNNFPEITDACIYQQVSHDIAVSYDNRGFYIKNIASMDNHFFDMFDVALVQGNTQSPINNLNDALISQKHAKLIFGDVDPIGKELVLMGQVQVLIVGIFEDFPSNSSMNAGLLVNAHNDYFKFSQHIGNSDDQSTYRWPFRIYLELRPSANPEHFIENVNQNIKVLNPFIDQAGLMPLHDVYLHDHTSGSNTKRGNFGLIQLLLSIALIILVMAVINYVNLSIAQQQKRGKEIGVRKSIGASKTDLITQFLFESVIVTVFAFGLSIIIYELCDPIFNQLFELKLGLSALLSPPQGLVTVAIVLGIGLLSGLWPALVFSSFNTVNIFSGKQFGSNRKSQFKNGLVIFQFAVSIALIFCVIVINKQIDFAKHKELGFNQDQLLRIDIPILSESKSSLVTAMANDLRQFFYISDASVTMGVPGQIRLQMGANMEGKDQGIAIIQADSSFLRTFDVTTLQGRGLLPGDYGKVCMINQTAMDYFEWDNLINKRYDNGREGGYEVIGVVEDFHVNSVHHAVKPTAIIFDLRYPSHISLKLDGNQLTASMDFIRKTWGEFLPEYPLEYQFYDDWFNSMYKKEERLGKVLSFFAILAISISSIGILGLAIFTAEKRTKEIGIRKVNGASVRNIILLLTRDFSIWVVIAYIIATPLAYLIIARWLEGFVYKTSISWWVYVISGLSALLIAWMTVGWQSFKAAVKNPVDTLRYE